MEELMMNRVGHYRVYVLAFVVVLLLAEMAWSWKNEKGVYNVRETLANLGIFAGFQVSKLLLTGYQLFWFHLAYDFTPLHLPANAWTFTLTFIVVDFLYYWHHRISHEFKFFWAFHVVHHSALFMNLTTSYRLNWLAGLVAVFFYLPAVVVGLPPEFVAVSVGINLLFQFFLHTEAVGKLGKLEGVINTPSAHRVHHASNEQYLDKNYGGVLMVWDRWFGTYIPETEKVKYGITTGFVSNNPFVLVFHGFVELLRKIRN